jgi:hypothetical protein
VSTCSGFGSACAGDANCCLGLSCQVFAMPDGGLALEAGSAQMFSGMGTCQ